jgi:hypothetical protein
MPHCSPKNQRHSQISKNIVQFQALCRQQSRADNNKATLGHQTSKPSSSIILQSEVHVKTTTTEHRIRVINPWISKRYFEKLRIIISEISLNYKG